MAADLVMPALATDPRPQNPAFVLANDAAAAASSSASQQQRLGNHHIHSHSHTYNMINNTNPSRHHHHQASSSSASGPQISPISPVSPLDVAVNHPFSTPPSPASHYSRQLRPIYMPAVLRPCDEFPSRDATWPKSVSSTPDSDSDSILRRSNSALMNLTGLGALGNRLSRRSTGDSVKTLDPDWDLDAFPPVTDLPSRKHWKPDHESSVCDDATCKRSFRYFIRRHHCRKCGNIFCAWHSSYVLPLDQDANFNPRGALFRACAHCFQQTKAMLTAGGPLDNSNPFSLPTPSHSPNAASRPAPRPLASSPVAVVDPGTDPAAADLDVAASVPRDWNWSTF